MFKVLKQSFPVNDTPWKVIAIPSVTVFFVLTLFQPFGLGSLGSDKWFRIIGFVLVTAISTAIVSLLFPLIFKKYYSIEKWTIGKYLFNTALIIFFIGVGNFIFDWNVTNRPSETFWNVLFSYFLITFLVGIIPITIISFVTQNYALKQYLREAKELNQQLLKKANNTSNDSPNEEIVTLTGNTKEKLSLLPNNILYIEASGNYVNIYYLTKEQTTKNTLLRTTISLLETMLSSHPTIQRCHRAFLVNVSHITNVEGNTQGLLLSIKYFNVQIPVSRTYTKQIKNAIE